VREERRAVEHHVVATRIENIGRGRTKGNTGNRAADLGEDGAIGGTQHLGDCATISRRAPGIVASIVAQERRIAGGDTVGRIDVSHAIGQRAHRSRGDIEHARERLLPGGVVERRDEHLVLLPQRHQAA
jgi:hypothetical protein